MPDPDKRTYWHGSQPKDCDICHKPLKKAFVDGATKQGWGLLCDPCHKIHGFGLGIGKGQRYVYDGSESKNPKWFKQVEPKRSKRTKADERSDAKFTRDIWLIIVIEPEKT